MKHNLKKCLSLFLAILMIMTSWVFVAPEKAEAVDSGNYRINVGIWTNRAGNDAWSAYLNYGYLENNGKSTTLKTGSVNITSSARSHGGELWEAIVSNIPGFPVYVHMNLNQNGNIFESNRGSLHIKSISINDVVMIGERFRAEANTITSGDMSPGRNSSWNYTWKASGYSGNVPSGGDIALDTWTFPYASKAVISSQPANVNLAKSGNATTTFNSYLLDQYGVKVASDAGYSRSYTLDGNSNSNSGVSFTSTASDSDKSTIKLVNEEKIAGTTNSKKVKATIQYTFNGKSASATTNEITVYDPKYTFTYKGNGGTLDKENHTDYYGNSVAVSQNMPQSGSRVGYKFVGMTTTENLGPSNSFIEPTEVPGTKLTTDTVINSDTTWNAYWWTKNINVTFLDNSGNIVKSIKGKYGQSIRQMCSEEFPEKIEYQKKNNETGTFDFDFEGWYISDAKKYVSGSDDTQEVYADILGDDINTQLFGDTEFSASFAPRKLSYRVIFYGLKGDELLNSEYSYDQLVTLPDDPEINEDDTYTYEFKGWKAVDNVQEAEIIDKGAYTSATKDILKVRKDAYYIPVFERTYKEYTVTFKNQDPKYGDYTYTGHYNDTYEVPAHADNYTLNGYRNTFIKWNETTSTHSALGKLTANAEFVAEYETTPAIYSIKFVDYDGSIIEEKEYAHGSAVVAPDATAVYRDDFYEYTFDKFVDEEGNLVSNIAGKDATYTATYTSNKLYIVNFFNGSTFLDSVKVVAGKQIPNYTGENPVKPDDNYAKNYIFQGFETSEGDRLEDIVMPEGNLNLFAKFDGTIINYVVKFMNDDEVVSETYYSYGEKVEIPENPTKDIDETYIYDFRGWDKEIETVCHGDMTYNAIYRKSYVYYPITWVNDDGSLIKTQKYIYNERLSAPDTDKLVSANMVPSSPAMKVVFKEWQYEDGTTYKRGDKVTSSVTLKAVYQETGKDCTVTFVNYDGTQLKKFNVAYDTKLENIDYPIPVKISTSTKHYTFSGWLADNEISKDRVLGDVVYTAQFTEENHVYKLKEVVTKPTFDKEGSAIWACDCEFSEVRTVDALTDNVAPSAFIIVGKNEWKDVADASFDVQTPVAGNNYYAITTSDTADVNETYNKNGAIGSGVDTISYLIWDKGGYVDPATLDESVWTLAWSYTDVYEKAKESYAQDAEGNLSPRDQAELDAKMAKLQANATGTLEQLLPADMDEGQDFVLVVRVIDKKGNAIYANTGVLCYDNVSPEVEITSAYNNGVKHCIDVSISVTDDSDIESVKVDGKDILAEADGSYRYTAPGLHQVVVTDVAGNNTKVNFEIVGKHVTKNIVKSATCTENGYSKEVCTLCGITTKEVEEITSPGHNPVVKITEATCTEDEVQTTYCTICLETLNVKTIEDTALGHEWAEHYTKESDCSHTGIYEEICNRCNETQSTVLEKNENVHTWYPPVTVKATCNQEGYKERTCKYCGKSEVLETYDKLNHVAGEWIVDVDPTCTTDGHKVAFCANCKSTDVVAEEVIPATGHSIVATIVPPTKDTQGYTKYECSKCDFVEIKDYTEKLDEYTVTFVVEGTETNVAKLNGETISSDDSCIPEAEKAEDNSNTYFFAGWKNADGEMVQFPITVTSDLTLTAVFTSRAKNYSVKLLNYDGTVFYKVGYNHYNEIVDLSSYKPIKPADDTNTYMFTGWKKQGADDSTKSMSIKIDTTDEIVLEPVFAAMVKEFNVVFAFDNYDVIKTYKNVKAGEDVVFDGETPLKQYIDGEHYNFVGWIGADETGTVKNVRNDVLVIAKFESEVHNTSNGIVIQSVSCTQPEITEYDCSCGYKFNRETIPAWGHNWSTVPEDRDGVHGFSCTNPGCGEFKEDTTTYTVTFVDDDKVTVLKTIAYLKWGETIEVPESPKKDDTTYSSFVFTGWTDAEGNAVDVETVIKSNATYYASYKKTEKIYTVVYAIDAEHVCAVYSVKGGDFVEYKGEIPVNYNPDAYGHREFDEWSEGGYTGTIDNVTSNMYIIAKFEKYDHSYNNKKIAATCTKPGGIEHTCIICNYSYLEKTTGELGHKWEIQKTEGFKVTYKCSNCGEFREEILPDTSVIADIYVTDVNGNPLTGAVVTIIDGNNQVNKGTTVSGGHLKLKVPKAKTYTIIVEYDRYNSAGEIVVNSDGSTVIRDVQIQLKACSCACHKSGAWGDIFRFFHKIIKLITGKYSCCEDPDRRYSK